MTIQFEFNNSDMVVECLYDTIKVSLNHGYFKLQHVEALAELLTELANRLKVEEADGESQG